MVRHVGSSLGGEAWCQKLVPNNALITYLLYFFPCLGLGCRGSKQPLISTEGVLGPARLWLTSSQGVLQAVMDYMSEVLFVCFNRACYLTLYESYAHCMAGTGVASG